jgi:hypothetical protein
MAFRVVAAPPAGLRTEAPLCRDAIFADALARVRSVPFRLGRRVTEGHKPFTEFGRSVFSNSLGGDKPKTNPASGGNDLADGHWVDFGGVAGHSGFVGAAVSSKYAVRIAVGKKCARKGGIDQEGHHGNPLALY